MINESQAGEKNIYFRVYFVKSNICDANTELTGFISIGTNDIPVYNWCKQFNDGSYYIELVARTDNGKAFVYEQFKNAPQNVKVNFHEHGNVYISAKGFTKSWEIN